MKIMEAGKATIQESVAHARELEVIHEDQKKGSTVGNIGADSLNNLDEEEKAAVDAIRLQLGRPPMNQAPQQPRPPQTPGTTRPPSSTGQPRSQVNVASARSWDMTKKIAEKEKQQEPRVSMLQANLTPINSPQYSTNQKPTALPPSP
jgi:hypothetical protein